MPSILKRAPLVLAFVGFALLAVPDGVARAQITQPPAQVGPGRIMSVPTGPQIGGGMMPGYIPPYNPYYPGSYVSDPNTGVANIISAQGQLMTSQQQAYMMREGVRSEKISNKRKAFDEYLYEKERTPTAEQDRQTTQKMYLDRARNNPPPTEIWSGATLNTLLQNLARNPGKAIPANSAPLNPDVLKNINVTSGRGGANAGLLKDGAKLTWPDALSGPEFKEDRDRVNSLLNDAVKQAEFNGQPDRGTVMTIKKDADTIARNLKKNIDSIDMNSYIEAKSFLSDLDSAIVALKQKDAASYLNGKYDLKARNVDELVQYMTANGLTFASAVPGQESAYNALYAAMANYDVALNSGPPK